MNGLSQASNIANDLLRQRLAEFGYHKTPHTPVLWKHIFRPIHFNLVVDDFGVEPTGPSIIIITNVL